MSAQPSESGLVIRGVGPLLQEHGYVPMGGRALAPGGGIATVRVMRCEPGSDPESFLGRLRMLEVDHGNVVPVRVLGLTTPRSAVLVVSHDGAARLGSVRADGFWTTDRDVARTIGAIARGLAALDSRVRPTPVSERDVIIDECDRIRVYPDLKCQGRVEAGPQTPLATRDLADLALTRLAGAHRELAGTRRTALLQELESAISAQQHHRPALGTLAARLHVIVRDSRFDYRSAMSQRTAAPRLSW